MEQRRNQRGDDVGGIERKRFLVRRIVVLQDITPGRRDIVWPVRVGAGQKLPRVIDDDVENDLDSQRMRGFDQVRQIRHRPPVRGQGIEILGMVAVVGGVTPHVQRDRGDPDGRGAKRFDVTELHLDTQEVSTIYAVVG